MSRQRILTESHFNPPSSNPLSKDYSIGSHYRMTFSQIMHDDPVPTFSKIQPPPTQQYLQWSLGNQYSENSIQQGLSLAGLYHETLASLDINSDIRDPTIIMFRADNKPLLEQIVGTHQNQNDDQSRKLTERAKKIMEILRDTKNQVVWRPEGVQTKSEVNEKRVSFREQTQQKIQNRLSNIPNRVQSTSRKVQSNIPTGVKQNSTVNKKEEQPHFHRPTRDFKKIQEDSRSSQKSPSVRLSLSRVLDIHQIIKTQEPRNSRISRVSSSFAQESIDKLEKSIQDLGKQLQQLKDHQKKTDQRIEQIKMEKLQDQIQRLSQRNSFELQTKPVERTERIKTIKIDIKKATVPITLKTSRKAVVIEIQKPRPQAIKHRCDRRTSSDSVRNSVESVKSSRVASKGYGQQPHKPPAGSYQIAKRKPLLTTRIAEKSMHQ